MAEKQYKNYDERFLKEDTSSGSRPVISYVVSNADEALRKDSIMFFKAKFEDGSYCQTSEDLLNLLRSGFILSVEQPGDYAFYSNQMILTVPNGDASTIAVGIDLSGEVVSYAYMVDSPTFEQLKQSKS